MKSKLHRGSTLIGSCEPIKGKEPSDPRLGMGILTIRDGIDFVPMMQQRLGQSAVIPAELRGKVAQFRMPQHDPKAPSRGSGALERVPYGPGGFEAVADDAILRIELEDGTMADPKHIHVHHFDGDSPWIVSVVFLEED